MDSGKIIERVKAILTTPRTEWPVIATEPATVKGLYTGYIAIVAALPAIASFLKGSLIGTSAFGITVRTPFGMGIVGMVLGYALSLALVYVMALIVNALAPSFGGRKDTMQALKVVAYALTASWVAGVAVIVPWLGWLIALAGAIYAIYLLYLGLPHTMQCPPEKAAGYTAVSVIIAFVLSWIIGAIVAGVIGTAATAGIHAGSSDRVTLDSNSALGRLAAVADDTNTEVEALPPEQIKAFLPERLGDLKRTSLTANRNNAIGMQVSEATARYGDDDGRQITIEVSDTGGAKGLMSLASAMAPEEDNQTEHGYEKTYTSKGNLVHEEWDNPSNRGEYSVVVGKRFTVKASGKADNIDQLKRAVASIDLRKLESLKGSGVTSR